MVGEKPAPILPNIYRVRLQRLTFDLQLAEFILSRRIGNLFLSGVAKRVDRVKMEVLLWLIRLLHRMLLTTALQATLNCRQMGILLPLRYAPPRRMAHQN